MKPLKERLFWKILIGIIIAIAVISVAVFFVCAESERRTIEINRLGQEEAKKAGYDKAYAICSRGEEVTFDGVSYVLYTMRWTSFIDSDYKEEFLIRKDATYTDETQGKTEGLIVYGKVTGFQNDPDDTVTYDPGKYAVVEPYKIAIYQKSVDMWAVVAAMVFAGLIDLVLIAVLVIYFVVYFVRSSKAETQKGKRGDEK